MKCLKPRYALIQLMGTMAGCMCALYILVLTFRKLNVCSQRICDQDMELCLKYCVNTTTTNTTLNNLTLLYGHVAVFLGNFALIFQLSVIH